jgi:hypothetical protein
MMLNKVNLALTLSAGASSGSVTGITFSNSNGISFGQNNGTVTGSFDNRINVSVVGSSANLTNIVFSNSNGFTFGLNGSTITASYTQSNQTVGGYAVGNVTLTSSTTFDARSISVDGAGGISVGYSNGSLVLSGPLAQTTQTQISESFFAVGNTYGTSSGTGINSAMSLRGVGNVSVAASGSGWEVSGSQSIQTQGIAADRLSLGVSTGGNTSGNTTVQSGSQIVFVGTNGITLSQGTGAGSTTITISGITQSNQSAIKGLGASNTGNTAGNTGLSTGIDWVVAGSNNITISESTTPGGPNTLWVSGANAGGAQTGISGIADSVNTQTKGTLSFANSNGVTFGLSTGANTATLTASVAAQTTQSAIKALGVSNTGNTAGNTGLSTGIDWVIAGSNMITASESTVGGGPNTIWVNATQTVQTQAITVDQVSIGVSTGGNTAGNTTVQSGNRLVFVGSNGITLSQGTGAGSTTITISGVTTAAQTNQSAIKGLGASNTGNTAGNTGLSTGIDWVVAGSNGITISESTAGGGPNTLWVSGVTTAAQTNQSAIKGLGVSNTGNTAGNTGLSSGIDWVVAGSNNITISESTTAGGPNTLWVSGANAGAAQFSIGVSTGGNTSGTTGVTGTQIVFAGTNAITLSQSNDATGATITLSVPQTSSISGTGWVQISTNGNTISIGATTTANLYAGGNTFGTSSGTADIRTESLMGRGIASVAASNSGWEISVPAYTNSIFEPIPYYNAGNSATVTASLSELALQPFQLNDYLSFNQLDLIGSASLTSTTAANTFTVSVGGASSFSFGYSASNSGYNLVDIILFTRGSGNYTGELFTAASTRNSFITLQSHAVSLSATSSGANSWGAKASSSVTVSVSFPLFTSGQLINGASSWTTWGMGYSTWSSTITTSNSTTGATNSTGSFSMAGTWPATTAWASNKLVPLNWASSLTPGEYWLGIKRASSTSSNSSSTQSNVGANNSYTTAINASNLTLTGQITWVGWTASIVNSLGIMGTGALATLAPDPGQGSFSGTYDPANTYLNAAGEPNGAIAFSQISTSTSFFRSWFMLANQRI